MPNEPRSKLSNIFRRLLKFIVKSNRKNLPEIEFVEVVDLIDVDVARVDQHMKFADNAPSVELTGDDARKIADLWRRMPPSVNTRCHNPPFGLRFYKDGKLYLQASLCWQCDNIYGELNSEYFFSTFDAEHKLSQELLQVCKQLFAPRIS